jgi:hypothetical protein
MHIRINPEFQAQEMLVLRTLCVCVSQLSLLLGCKVYRSVKVNRYFGGIYCVHFQTKRVATCLMLVYCLVYSSILKMEAVRSSETSLEFYRTTQRYNKEYHTLHDRICFCMGMERDLSPLGRAEAEGV